jgi:hypothetical protein
MPHLWRQDGQRPTKFDGQGSEVHWGYFLFAGAAAGLPGTAASGDRNAVTFALFCLSFFGSRSLRLWLLAISVLPKRQRIG